MAYTDSGHLQDNQDNYLAAALDWRTSFVNLAQSFVVEELSELVMVDYYSDTHFVEEVMGAEVEPIEERIDAVEVDMITEMEMVVTNELG